VPELPDLDLYLHALRPRIAGQRLQRIRLASPFLVRSVDPPIHAADGKLVIGLRRLGKRVVWVMEGDLFLVIHLMIAGRFRWKEAGAKVPGRLGLAAFDFPTGTLLLTEAGSQRRASVHLVRGEGALAELDPGGIEVLGSTLAEFAGVIARENHTLKRALTDPHLFSGIGNAYSDEILHAAKLSPMQLTNRLTPEQVADLHGHVVHVLTKWRDALIAQTGGAFPEKVTAFRDEMAAHGKYGKPCPACGTPIQRIKYASNEANYCPTCQTGGRLLADRGLSRLLKGDWPKTLEELDRRSSDQKTVLKKT
jgi:formamidopyrimidine-DNA glycosylase